MITLKFCTRWPFFWVQKNSEISFMIYHGKKIRLATSPLHEFLSERSELFWPRCGQGSDEVTRGRPAPHLIGRRTFLKVLGIQLYTTICA